MDAVLTGEGISVAYHQNIVIPAMDVQIPGGNMTSIIGPNGCGKSTLLKALSRMTPVREGHVFLDGSQIAKMSTVEVAKKMAILPQGPQAPGGLTVKELVSYGRYPHQRGFGRLKKRIMRPLTGRSPLRIWRGLPAGIWTRSREDSGRGPGSPWPLPRIRLSSFWMSQPPIWI